MSSPPGTLNARHVRRRLQAAAAEIDRADFVHARTAEGLFERLLPMRIEAKRVLDLGCGNGSRMQTLAKRFPGAAIIGADLSSAMLQKAAARGRWLSRPSLLLCDAAALPLPDNSADLVFANLLLPFVDDHEQVLGEVSRVLRQDGLFVFATLGPDSFRQLRDAWQDIDGPSEQVRSFPDMHIIGDALVRSRLRDPVLDVEHLEIRYSNAGSMYRDLTAAGARNSLANRRRAMTGRGTFGRMEAALAEAGDADGWQVTLELVFGHAWGGADAAAAGEFHVNAASIGRRE